MAIVSRIYAALVHLYPHKFRDEFGEEMQATFDDLVAETSKLGPRALMQVNLREILELILAIVQEHLRRRNMTWLNRHMNVWRGIEFALLLVALIGPWWFDRIYVPSQYSCSAPIVRLEGDFCGVPMSGTSFLWIGIVGLFNIVAVLITGTAVLTDRIREFAVSLVLLPVLPFISGLLMILGRYRRRRHVFHIIALGLAASFALFVIMHSFAGCALWGLWLYIGVAVAALMLEMLTLNHPKEPSSDHSLEVLSQ